MKKQKKIFHLAKKKQKFDLFWLATTKKQIFDFFWLATAKNQKFDFFCKMKYFLLFFHFYLISFFIFSLKTDKHKYKTN